MKSENFGKNPAIFILLHFVINRKLTHSAKNVTKRQRLTWELNKNIYRFPGCHSVFHKWLRQRERGLSINPTMLNWGYCEKGQRRTEHQRQSKTSSFHTISASKLLSQLTISIVVLIQRPGIGIQSEYSHSRRWYSVQSISKCSILCGNMGSR